MPFGVASNSRLIAETEAGMHWMSPRLDWRHLALPFFGASAGVALAGIAMTAARNGATGMSPLWWVGVICIFAPAAAVLLFSSPSRTEAISILLLVGGGLYCVKLLYAPGTLFGYDELLHYRTVDNILTTGQLFSPNTLLPVSPYYPGMEIVTAILVQLTGLSTAQAGVVLIGTVRMLSLLAIFLLLELFASPSRFAAPATLLYMTCPAFLYFDSAYAYESLALALALVTLFVLAAAQREQGARRQWLNAVGALLVLTVTVTHHVTSFILTGALVAWLLFQLLYERPARTDLLGATSPDKRERKRLGYLLELPGSTWVPVLSFAAVTLWLLNVAQITIPYLLPVLKEGFAEVAHAIIIGDGGGRQLFTQTAGHSTPALERLVALGAVALILILIPIGLKYVRERPHASVLSQFFAIGSLGYPVILALRLTENGWTVGSRASAFIYLPVAFTVAAGLELLISRYVGRNRLLESGVVLGVVVIFAGGILASTIAPTRLPSPYDPGVAEVPYDTESLAAAAWAADTLGPGHRFAGDSAGGALFGSVGRQALVASTKDDVILISQLFLTPYFGGNERAILRDGKIDYVLVDRRIAGSEPIKRFIYETWERQVVDYGSSVSSETVNKFSSLPEASKEFDSGNLQFFDVQRLAQ